MFVDTKFFASNYNRIHDISLDVQSTTSYKLLAHNFAEFYMQKTNKPGGHLKLKVLLVKV